MISVTGVVSKRPDSMINPDMPTGEVEVIVEDVVIHNVARNLPFLFHRQTIGNVSEELLLEYRYLDLRQPTLQENLRCLSLRFRFLAPVGFAHDLRLRSRVTKRIRDYFHGVGFTEIETPTLFKSTPEGAREFLVPTRQKGKFYSLPQSPQQYKQLLMVSGFEKYFQIARCYRDETGRSDRQPEFTQVGIFCYNSFA